MCSDMAPHVFGIRHHGPGCARALRSALEQLAPDVVLVEGPPDADDTLAHVASTGMTPPVALLVHAADDPQNASFYPFADFSPEWQALRYCAERGVPSRFIDLPCAYTLAMREPVEATADEPESTPALPSDDELREDPLGMLAEAAGYTDHEQWWDVQIEHRLDATGLFEAILEAMTALREQHVETRTHELRREAHMRSAIRTAQKERFAKIAVVCGAWHAPALATLGPAKADSDLLKGLQRVKVAATWIPWTYSRLSFRSGYGAGVDSPGWYAHLWKHGEKAAVVWATLAARLLRGEDLDASAANVIEAVRLADALASIRDLPTPGLAELREAIEAVLCGGERTKLALIRARLEIGDALGEVPEQVGRVPLMQSFEEERKRLRLELSSELVTHELDMRKDRDRDRSRLLHRLRVLGVEWGRPLSHVRSTGTFKEGWQIAWRPELAVDLIAANIHGNTVESASTSMLAERAKVADLSDLSGLVEVAILAHLPSSLDVLLVELDARAATSADVQMQMRALGPLARLVRYGDVRSTRTDHVRPVLEALFERVIVGLPPACTQLDDDAAAQMIEALGDAHKACLLLDEAALLEEWLATLRALLDAAAAHARIRGRACRLLHQQRALAAGELARQASLALGIGVEPAHATQWIEGLVAGEGLSLVHEEELLATLDDWLSALADDTFQAQLPLLRRGFAGLEAPERRAVAQRIKSSRPGASRRVDESHGGRDLDDAKVALVLPVLAQILGVNHV